MLSIGTRLPAARMVSAAGRSSGCLADRRTRRQRMLAADPPTSIPVALRNNASVLGSARGGRRDRSAGAAGAGQARVERHNSCVRCS
jgi:hypothetical protein